MPNAMSILRHPSRTIAAVAVSTLVLACGSAPSPSTGASQAAPSVAAPSIASTAPSVAPSVAPPSAGVAPSGSATAAVDAAAGLKIAAPYGLADLPAALVAPLRTQFETSLGSQASIGFRTVSGTSAQMILVVFKFPNGSVNEGVLAALRSMTESQSGASLTTTTVDGVPVSTGKGTSGGIAMFSVGDSIFFVAGGAAEESLAVSKAVISANK